MDEMTMFAELRPTESPMTEAELASLRAELFPNAAPPARPDEPGRLIDLAGRRRTDQRDRRRGRVAIAAAVIVAVGIGGVWLAIARDTDKVVPAQQPDDSSPAVEPAPAAVGAYELPRFAFTESGWTMTSASEGSYGRGRAVVFLSDDGFDGPWVEIGVTSMDDVGILPEVDFGAISAHVSEFDNGSLVYWTEPGGRLIQASGWQVDSATVARLLESTTVTDRVVTVGNLPEGATLADRKLAYAIGLYASYRFSHADGRELSISVTGGGDRSLYQRIGGQERTTLAVGTEEWSFDNRQAGVPGRYHADVLRDFWTWEFYGDSFATPDTARLDAGRRVSNVPRDDARERRRQPAVPDTAMSDSGRRTRIPTQRASTGDGDCYGVDVRDDASSARSGTRSTVTPPAAFRYRSDSASTPTTTWCPSPAGDHQDSMWSSAAADFASATRRGPSRTSPSPASGVTIRPSPWQATRT